MISVSLEPKWRHFAQVNIADIFMLSSKLPKQNEMIVYQESILSQSACSRPCGSPALLYLSTRATPDKSLLGLLLLRCDMQNVENQWHRW